VGPLVPVKPVVLGRARVAAKAVVPVELRVVVKEVAA